MHKKIFKGLLGFCGVIYCAHSYGQMDLELNDLEIPAICENIQDFVSPVDLSPACLAAQTAAQAYPPLLPAANQLCQTLEGATATLGVIQIEINTIYEKCQLELAKLEEEMTSGLTGFENLLNSEIIKKKRLLDAMTSDELEEKAIEEDLAFLSEDEWIENIDLSTDTKIKDSRKKMLKEVFKANYVADQILMQGVADDLINIIVQLLHRSSDNVSIKESQDLNARMTAELVYQQQAFQQILTQYMALLAAEQEVLLAEEKYIQEFFGDSNE